MEGIHTEGITAQKNGIPMCNRARCILVKSFQLRPKDPFLGYLRLKEKKAKWSNCVLKNVRDASRRNVRVASQ